jgi:hypothetical protein
MLGIVASFSWGDNFTYVTFTDRDLLRGSTFFDDLEFLGSELGSRSARTPGGMMSAITASIQHFFPSVYHIYLLGLIWNVLAGITAATLLRRVIGLSGALAFAALYFTGISILELFWKFWNPSPTIGFSAVACAILMRCLAGTMSSWVLLICGALLSLAAQFHISFLGGFGLSLAGTLIAAPRRSVRFIPILIIGFLIPFVPFIVADAVRGFEWTQDFLGPREESAARHLECITCMLGLILIKLSGGQIYFPEYVPDVGLPQSVTAGLLNLLNLPVMLVAVFVVFVVTRLVNIGRDMDSPGKSVSIYLGYMLIVAPIVLLPYASHFNARYYIVFIVPFIMLSAVGFAYLLGDHDSTSRRRTARLVAAAIAALLIAKATMLLGYYLVRPAETLSAYAFKRDVVDALYADWGLRGDKIPERLSLYVVDGPDKYSGWRGHSENQGLTYIAHVRAPGTTPDEVDECVAVVTRLRMTGLTVDVPDGILGQLPSTFEYTKTRQLDYDNFSIIGFRTGIPSNCPRSFVHAYKWSPEQKAIMELLSSVPQEAGPIRIADPSDDRIQYVLPVPGSGIPGLMIDTANETGIYRIDLRSLNMGGYAASAGHDYTLMRNPSFVLEAETGETYRRTIQATVGEEGIYAPLAVVFEDVPHGTYKLRFAADGYRIVDNVSNGVVDDRPAFDVLLDEHVEIPDGGQ